jgi:hypothetical protein
MPGSFWNQFVQPYVQFAENKRREYMYGMLEVGKQQLQTVWVLGESYEAGSEEGFSAYMRHFESVMWLTYRRGLQGMPNGIVSDTGWGCMLRSAQMQLAQALQRHKLGDGWRLGDSDEDRYIAVAKTEDYITVMKLMADYPLQECVFSLQNMVRTGEPHGKRPGEWYGPGSAASVVKELLNARAVSEQLNLCVYVPVDGVVYLDIVDELCGSSGEGGTNGSWSKSLVLLIPTRLGLDKMHADYVQYVLRSFQYPQSIGIIGGRKSHSLYYVAAEGGSVHVLDPHTTHEVDHVSVLVGEGGGSSSAAEDGLSVPQQKLGRGRPGTGAGTGAGSGAGAGAVRAQGPWKEFQPGKFPTAAQLRQRQCSKPMSVRVDLLDPSLAFGFYCRSREDLVDFQQRTAALAEELGGVGQRVPFSVSPTAPAYIRADMMGQDEGREQERAVESTHTKDAHAGGGSAPPPGAPADEPAADFKTVSGVEPGEAAPGVMAPMPQMIRSSTREKERKSERGTGCDANSTVSAASAAPAAPDAVDTDDNEQAGGGGVGLEDDEDEDWELM